MRVLFLIPKAKAPILEGPFSSAFKEFVALCLTKDPSQRQTAKELLQHRFIRTACKTNSLTEWIERYQDHVARSPGKPAQAQQGVDAAGGGTWGANPTLRSSWSFDTVRMDAAMGICIAGGVRRQVLYDTRRRRCQRLIQWAWGR